MVVYSIAPPSSSARLHAGDRGALLADRDVHAAHLLLGIAGLPVLALVEDRVDADRGLAGLAVADDQLALAAPDRGLRVDGLDAGLQRLADALPLHHRRRLQFQRAAGVGLDVALSVDRLAERVDHPAEERVADRHRQHLAGALDLLALFDLLEVAEDHRADAVLVEVQRDAEHPAGELEELLRHHRGQALDVGDAVTGVDDGADLFTLGIGGERGDVVLDRTFDVSQPRLSTLPWLFVFLPFVLGAGCLSGSQSGSWVWAAASRDAMEPSITSSPTVIERPPRISGSMCELDGHRVAVDPGQHLGQPRALGIGQFRGGGDLRDDLTASRHGEFGEIDDRLVGTLAAQQFDCLRQQCRGGAVDPAPLSRTLFSNAIRPSAGIV